MFLCFIIQHTSIESRDVEAVDICAASASTNVQIRDLNCDLEDPSTGTLSPSFVNYTKQRAALIEKTKDKLAFHQHQSSLLFEG